MWTGREVPFILQADGDSHFVDQNGARMSKYPMLPLFAAADAIYCTTTTRRRRLTGLPWMSSRTITACASSCAGQLMRGGKRKKGNQSLLYITNINWSNIHQSCRVPTAPPVCCQCYHGFFWIQSAPHALGCDRGQLNIERRSLVLVLGRENQSFKGRFLCHPERGLVKRSTVVSV